MRHGAKSFPASQLPRLLAEVRDQRSEIGAWSEEQITLAATLGRVRKIAPAAGLEYSTRPTVLNPRHHPEVLGPLPSSFWSPVLDLILT